MSALRFQRPTVLLYSPPGRGKTVAIIRALDPAATAYGCFDRGALIPATIPSMNPWRDANGKLKKYAIADELLDTTDPFKQADEWVKSVCKEAKKGKIKAVALDTLTAFCDREMSKIVNVEKVSDSYGKRNKALKDRVLRIIHQCMESELIVVAAAHEQAASEIEGKYKPNGPKLSGDMVDAVPGMFDAVLPISVEYDEKAEARVRWVRVDPLDSTRVAKDRYGLISEAGGPLDLRAYLQAAVRQAAESAL